METEKITEKQKIYSYKDAYESTLQYFEGDDLAAKVWVSKYALKDSGGNIYEKTPDRKQLPGVYCMHITLELLEW